MNDLVIQNVVVIPILRRNGADAVSRRLRGYDFHPWAPQTGNLAAWYREASRGTFSEHGRDAPSIVD